MDELRKMMVDDCDGDLPKNDLLKKLVSGRHWSFTPLMSYPRIPVPDTPGNRLLWHGADPGMYEFVPDIGKYRDDIDWVVTFKKDGE